MNKPVCFTHILYFLFLASVLFFNSCSNDTTTGPLKTVSDSLIFSKDSLVAYSDSTISNSGFSYTNDSCDWHIFKFSFTGETNDTSNSYIELIISDGESNTFYTFYKEHSDINNSFNVSCSITRNSNPRLNASLVEDYHNVPVGFHKYIKIKNFKLYRTN